MKFSFTPLRASKQCATTNKQNSLPGKFSFTAIRTLASFSSILQLNHWPRIIGLIVYSILFSQCQIFGGIASGITLQYYDLPKQGVVLAVPRDWETSTGDFFQLSARGNLQSYANLSFEYRGLPNNLKSMNEKKLYADGWYDAFIWSYRDKGAKLLDRSQNLDEPEGTFQMIGQYEDPDLGTMIKFGLLHFRNSRMHALYYVAPKKGFEVIFDVFRLMESHHRFYAAQ